MKINIFVSGEEGLIAREMIKQLKQRKDVKILNELEIFNKFRTYNYYKNLKNFLFNNKKRYKEIDITNPKLCEAFKKLKCDMIIHCAAYVNSDKCSNNLEDAIDSNIKGTFNLVNIAKENNIKFVNFSTTATFDPLDYSTSEKLDEMTKRKPQTHYGQTKMVAEMIVKWNLKNYLNFLPVFIYGLYPYDNSSELVKIIYSNMKNLKTRNVNLSPSNYKAYFYVEDAVRAIIRIIFNRKSWKLDLNDRDFVIGTREYKLYEELINIIESKLNKKIKAIFIKDKDYLHDHIATAYKMQAFAPDWAQRIFINEGIQKIIDSIK